jgi:excisionase family DNA binding protein
MAEQIQTEWLSLQQASQVLGVHTATLRAWSDRGRIASRRTPGGHRRFSRADLEAWLESQRRRAPGAELLVQSALGRMRMEMTRFDEGIPAWLARFDEPMRQSYRETGRQLLGLLLRFISNPDQRAETLEQVRDIGRHYAVVSRANGLSLVDSVQAVLFFHTSLTSSIVQMAASLNPAGGIDWVTTHRLATSFVNDVLLALVEAYTAEALA